MKKTTRILSVVGVIITATSILGLNAFAAVPPLPEVIPSDSVAHKYTVIADTSDGLAQSGEVLMLVVKGIGEDVRAELSDGDITYIDQATVVNGSVEFKDFIPASSDSTVFIVGAGIDEPKPIGYIAGWGVKGTVTVSSYDPKKSITVTLKKSGTDEVEAVKIIGGVELGAGASTVTFDLEDIPDGTYDLLVSKDGHVAYKITGLIVDGEDLDLTANPNPLISTITLPGGELTGDGYINSSDVSTLVSLANYGTETKDAANKLADINGDGFVNSSDVSILLALANYGQSQATLTVDYSE
jgi:hypothetical protein